MKSLKKRLIELGAKNIRCVMLRDGGYYKYDLNGTEHIVKIQTFKQFTQNEKEEEQCKEQNKN